MGPMGRRSTEPCVADGRGLILGLGNVSRQDDGFGWAVVNEVRRELGRPLFDLTDDGTDDLGQEVDAIVLPQVSSDLAELVAEYRRLVLVDARVAGPMRVHVERVGDQPERARLLTHDMQPAELLTLARTLYGAAPEAYAVSVPGISFDFVVGLSPAVAELVPEAARVCLELARGCRASIV
jgi:hydrogenase maturation protease